MNKLQYLVTEINENNNYIISDLMNTPNDYDGITKNSIIKVNIEQGVIEEEKVVSIDNNGSTVIEPSEGYDSIEKVVVNTNIPNQTTNLTAVVNGNYTPQLPYIGYNSVTVNVPQISNETLINKRITSNNNIPVSDLMSDSVNYAGISKNSNIIVDVPVPDITQISNYSITSNGLQNVPIPSGYDAVDSISLNVNVPSQFEPIIIDNVQISYNDRPYNSATWNLTKVTTLTNITLQPQQSIGWIRDFLEESYYVVYIRKNGGSTASTFSLAASVFSPSYYLQTPYESGKTSGYYFVLRSGLDIVSQLSDYKVSDTDYTACYYYKNFIQFKWVE